MDAKVEVRTLGTWRRVGGAMSYLDGQKPVENTQKDLLVDVHSLEEINCPLGFCQVVVGQF